MMVRSAWLIVAGLLLAGCSRVMGTASYRHDNAVIGEEAYGHGTVIAATPPAPEVKNVEATADARTASATLDADRVREREGAVERPAGSGNWADPERAAYAATMTFPADAKAIADVPLAASVDRDRSELVVRNDSDQALNNVNVWINGQYVAWVGQIPAHDRVSLPMKAFSDARGHGLKDWSEASGVQLQSGDRLFNTTGLEKR
jgi:hypothetical protein